VWGRARDVGASERESVERWRKLVSEKMGTWEGCEIEVAQTSKSAVSQVSKPAMFRTIERLLTSHALPIWKSAIQQVRKPALRSEEQPEKSETSKYRGKPRREFEDEDNQNPNRDQLGERKHKLLGANVTRPRPSPFAHFPFSIFRVCFGFRIWDVSSRFTLHAPTL